MKTFVRQIWLPLTDREGYCEGGSIVDRAEADFGNAINELFSAINCAVVEAEGKQYLHILLVRRDKDQDD